MSTTLHDFIGEQYIYAQTPSVTTTTTSEVGIKLPFKCKIISVHAIPQATITGQATNYGSYEFYNRGTAGDGTTELGDIDFDNGTNAADFQAAEVYAPTTELAVADATYVSCKVAKTSSGMTIPATTWVILIRGN